MRVYGYLRASTKEQNAERAKDALQNFADENGFTVSAWFIENESGAKLQRPQLLRLLEVADKGDVLLVEQVDRISRLDDEDWKTLKSHVNERGVRIVAKDLPTSHYVMKMGDEFTDRMVDAMNTMMLDMLAAIARKDYKDRKRRQAEGVQRAKAQGKYNGRGEDKDLQRKIEILLKDGKSYSNIVDLLECSRHTIAKVNKRLKEEVKG